jgi:hypothetical protein
MCRELNALRQSIKTYAGDFDARHLLPAQAARVVHICAQIEASVGSLKALAAARAAEGNRWRDEGYRSPADHLAHDIGVSPATAKRTLETGKRLAQPPDVAAAALAGQLSAEQAEAVSDGVAANPAKAKELVEKAQHSSLPELNEEVARTKAAVTDQEVRRQTIHAKRSLRRWTDRDGALQAHLYGTTTACSGAAGGQGSRRPHLPQRPLRHRRLRASSAVRQLPSTRRQPARLTSIVAPLV